MVHGAVEESGTLTDLLYRNKARRMTVVASQPGKGVQEAVLHYRRVGAAEGFSKVRIRLVTGRTHQIRVQFASRGNPLAGERKYAQLADSCEIALWSYRLRFRHPRTGEAMTFSMEPPKTDIWCMFE